MLEGAIKDRVKRVRASKRAKNIGNMMEGVGDQWSESKISESTGSFLSSCL